MPPKRRREKEKTYVTLRGYLRKLAHKIDQAITLGVASAYPMVFNMPTPDPVPDWKNVVRLSWKVVRVTSKETIRLLREVP
jgi:hypothetical protein